MSTHKNTRSTTSPVSHVHNVLGHLLRDFTRFPALIFNILFRDQHRLAQKSFTIIRTFLFHALKFYSEMFTLSFLISVAASQFKLFEGDLEWRGLLYIAMQMLIAIPIIYILCRALPEKIPLSNMMQAIF